MWRLLTGTRLDYATTIMRNPYSNEKQGLPLLANMINSLPIPEHIQNFFPSKIIAFLEKEAEMYKPIHQLISVSSLFLYIYSIRTTLSLVKHGKGKLVQIYFHKVAFQCLRSKSKLISYLHNNIKPFLHEKFKKNKFRDLRFFVSLEKAVDQSNL